jgi:hypothetical protein
MKCDQEIILYVHYKSSSSSSSTSSSVEPKAEPRNIQCLFFTVTI